MLIILTDRYDRALAIRANAVLEVEDKDEYRTVIYTNASGSRDFCYTFEPLTDIVQRINAALKEPTDER